MNTNNAPARLSVWDRMTPAQRRAWSSQDRARAAATAARNLGR